MEAEANAAPAIRTWWYPGRSIGHEFIYPKDHARRLASRQSEGVLTVSGDAAGDDAMRTADLARIGRDGQEAAIAAESSAQTTTAQTTPGTPAESQTASTTTQTTQSSTAAATTPAPTTPAAPETTTAASAQAQTTTPSTTGTQAATSAQTSSSQQAASATTAADTTGRTELPRTASFLPLIGLLGLGSLLGAGLLRLRR
jgi:hypothetical protein